VTRNAVPGVLAITLALVVAYLVGTSCAGGDEGDGADPTRTRPGPTGTITAAGRIAFIGRDGRLTLVNPNGSEAQPLTEAAGVQEHAWSPDGSLIAFARSVDGANSVEVVRVDGEIVFEVSGATAPLWSPPGDRLLVERSGGLEILDPSGAPFRTFPSAILPDWSPDGSAVAFIRTSAGGNGVPMIGTVASGEERPLDEALAPEQAVYPVVWHPGGSVLAYRNGLYEPGNGARTELPGIASSFSPDGRLILVILGADPTVTGRPAQLLDLTAGALTPVIGIEVRPAPDGTPPWLYVLKWMDWSADSRIFFYMDPDEFRPRVRIFDTIGLTQDTYPEIRGEYPDLSPDSTHATFQYQGQVWVLPLNATALLPIIDGGLPRWQPRAN
jgi:hypothetical protein